MMTEIVILDINAPRSALYASWIGSSPIPCVVVQDYDTHWMPQANCGLVVTAQHYRQPEYSILRRLSANGIPTLIIADGILEYRNTWEHPELAAGCMFQPVIGDKIACLGRSQARVLESWGNLGKCELVGSPRLDPLLRHLGRNRQPKATFRFLVMTAKKLGLTAQQVALAKRSVRDLKFWFSQYPTLNGFEIQVVWRLTQGLAQEIGVTNTLQDFDSRELARILETVDAVITTPSTSMLEAMLCDVPVALLDYNNSPHYVPAAWNITAPRHMDQVLPELIIPPAAKMLYQTTVLHDALECQSPATPRMTRLIEEMVRIAQDCRNQKLPLRYPARILTDPQFGFHMPEPTFDMSKLYPNHPVFAETDRSQLQVQVNQLERETASLRKQIAADKKPRAPVTWVLGPKKISRLCRSVWSRYRRVGQISVDRPKGGPNIVVNSASAFAQSVEAAILSPQYESQRYIDEYLKPHMRRFQETVSLLRGTASGEMRLIDIGSYGSLVPVFTDILQLNDIVITEPSQAGKAQSEETCLPNAHNGQRYRFRVGRFNIESRFPYADGQFDIVLFTEVLEHLATDPVHTLSEINRITIQGGWLLLSTPNVASAKSVVKILRGGNPSFYSVYTKDASRDRHNREYAPSEVKQLLTLCGYEIVLFKTKDVYDEQRNTISGLVKGALRVGSLLSLGLLNAHERGDTIFALAKKTSPIKERYPSFLYS